MLLMLGKRFSEKGKIDMDIKDFKVGQTVYIELTGNAERGKVGENLIEEWQISRVGKKYIYAKKNEYMNEIPFLKDGRYGNQWFQKTDYCVDYILYATKKELEDKLEKEQIFDEVYGFFRRYDAIGKITLEQLKEIKRILSEE